MVTEYRRRSGKERRVLEKSGGRMDLVFELTTRSYSPYGPQVHRENRPVSFESL